MSLTLYYHPLASFCWKALIALYENQIPFTPLLVDLGDTVSRESFLKVWPIGEFPVLQDGGSTVPQSTVIIEYLSLRYPGEQKLVPSDPELALEARRWNEFYDNYVHTPMQQIVADALRPTDQKDSIGVAEARLSLLTAYGVLEKNMRDRTWAVGEAYTLADCAASPALFYANKVEPFEKTHPNLARYLDRLKQRHSFARVIKEAEPYFHLFPYKR